MTRRSSTTTQTSPDEILNPDEAQPAPGGGEDRSADAGDESQAEPTAEGAGAGVEPAEDSVDSSTGPGDSLTDEELQQSVAALVFASPEPISTRKLQDLLERPVRARIDAALEAMRERLAASGLPLELRAVAGGHQILTRPELGDVVQRLFKSRRTERISSAALETLAVVAYRQPVSKAEIEAIRGVQAGPILRTLIERGLVRVTGRADVPGHPLQYGTTREFLERFGLANLADLPRDAELTKD
ncbi:MAG: SMC-Scp complex subunit ScpB [Planctomycetes bacterium]|nr:SMC-Scp complex subunit ScpB [Planctomycetota bacterium]